MQDQAQRQLQQVSTIQRFSQVTPESFRQEIESLDQPLQAVKETIIEQVESGALSPLEGLNWFSCAQGSAYGYAEFHGLPSASDSVHRAMASQSVLTPSPR